MKAISGFLLGAIVLALVGGVCLAAGILDREMAHAQEHVVSGDYDEPQAILDTTERYFEYATRLPRVGHAESKDRQTTLAALDAGINAYLTVLKNTARQEDAAYNYEFLVRLRDDIAKGRRKAEPTEISGPHGHPGGPPFKGKNDFKIYVPLQSDEIDKGATSGKAAPIKRKG